MNGCKPLPLFFALALGSQINPRLRRAAALLEQSDVLADSEAPWKLNFGGLSPRVLEKPLYQDAAAVGGTGAGKLDLRKPPRSPPHAADVSPSDEFEKVDYAAAVVSDEVGSVPSDLPRTGTGATCEAACLTCMQLNSNFPSCQCFATCQSGGSGRDACTASDTSWSNNNPTMPSESWEGKCQEGKVTCSDCVSEDLIAENDRCGGDFVCMQRLQLRISAPISHARYCSNRKLGLAHCETFTYEPKENGWTCYTTLHQCENGDVEKPYESSPEFGPPDGELQTPCIWCETTGQEDPSAREAAALQVGIDDVNIKAVA